MQEFPFLKTDIVRNDLAARSVFLAKSEELLTGSHFQRVCELARARLVNIPGDIDARIVLVRALQGSGNRTEALDILADVRRSVARWSSMLDLLEDPVLNNTLSLPESPGSKGFPEFENDSIGQPGGQILQGEFYTMTMADLFISQGHVEMARQVLEGILRDNPNDSGAMERLKVLKRSFAKASAATSEKKRSAELERWLGKLKAGTGR